MEIKDYRTPGQLINDLLIAKGWSQRVLAIILKMDETGVNRILADKRPITAELAITLQELFNEPAERFLQLQSDYDLARAKITMIPDNSLHTRARLFGDLPVADMIKRGWLRTSDVRDVAKVETELARFFGVTSSDQIEIFPHVSKKTIVNGQATPTQLAWLYRVRQIASDMIAARYSTKLGSNAIPQLSALLAAREEARKVPRILAECGIRFVIVESLPSAKIDGVCFWLDSTHPVIGLSLRHDRIDNFWFVLRHELEHVLRFHGRSAIMLDTEVDERLGISGEIPEEEQVANQAAAEFCVPSNLLERFISRKAPLFTERDLLGFARSLNVHPGLVVGQLHHRTGRYELFRKYLVRIRAVIAPSAIVDGWGDVAPIEL